LKKEKDKRKERRKEKLNGKIYGAPYNCATNTYVANQAGVCKDLSYPPWVS